jgi:hypothetical protein
MPVTYTDINMDAARDMSRIGQENPRVPASPELMDDEFLQYFDWDRYCKSTQPLDNPSSSSSPYPSPPPSRDLANIIDEIPEVIDTLSFDKLRSELYRMRASFRPDDAAASMSDYSGQTPPDLVQGGSTSPSDHSGSVGLVHAEDLHQHNHHQPDVTLREAQAQDDEWTYPQTIHSKAPLRHYPPHLQVPDDQVRPSVEQASGLKRRRSGNLQDKRRRQLADPVQTADVRKTGACLPCRVSKTRCCESGVCPTCRKAFPKDSHLACTRDTPAMTWPVIGKVPDVWSRDAMEEEQLCSGPRFYMGTPREISIFFERDPSYPALDATVQAYKSENGTDRGACSKVDFPRESVPSHGALQRWVENQIRLENGPDFRKSVQNFLLQYSEYGFGLPKHNLAVKVHKMNCFFRLWQTSGFWCRDPSNKIVKLPVSVQAQLRKIAYRALYSLEHDVLKELDECLTQQGPPKLEERLAIWASMWQLLLMYRDLIIAFHGHLANLKSIAQETQFRKFMASY